LKVYYFLNGSKFCLLSEQFFQLIWGKLNADLHDKYRLNTLNVLICYIYIYWFLIYWDLISIWLALNFEKAEKCCLKCTALNVQHLKKHFVWQNELIELKLGWRQLLIFEKRQKTSNIESWNLIKLDKTVTTTIAKTTNIT
jgi:predicted deacetylase